MARYPAVPLIVKLLSQENSNISLDDINRFQEKEVGESWSNLLKRSQYHFLVKFLLAEKR